MKVRRLLTALVAVAAVVAVPSASVSAATPTPSPRSQLGAFSCTHALDPGARAVAVKATMRPLSGTRRMAIRFELLQRSPGLPVQEVSGGDLGVWRTPLNPTLGQLPGDVWRLQKSVYNLEVPFTYQFRVSFRWTGVHGQVLETATRYTHSCLQRELRPDLTVTSISVSAVAGHPDKELYTATIANQGLTGAGPFQVLFAPGDSSAPTIDTVNFLGAGKTRTLAFVGPLCDAANAPTVSADSASQIDDLNRANNEVRAVCPATKTS
ncbi:MAG: CARDB domain-containing protein [Solirubrobacteraceae bacterium]